MSRFKQFGERLIELRKSRNMTQIEAADLIGISRSYLAGIESGHDLPGRRTLVALADFYKVSLDYLQGLAASTDSPESGEFVNDPDELAWLRFWRSLTHDERLVALRLLGGDRKKGRRRG